MKKVQDPGSLGCGGTGFRFIAAGHWNLSSGQTHLDSHLDDIQHWLDLPLPGRLLLGHRFERLQALGFPALVVGMNSITMYCLVHLMDRFVARSLKIHLGQQIFELFGATYEPILQGAAVLLVLWLICFWMYKRKIFLRI